MTELINLLNSDYPSELLTGMVVNFQIALIALAFGLALGVPCVLILFTGRFWTHAINPLVGLMRAAPTFVVMFFLLNTVPRQFQVLGANVSLSPELIVALSLVPYVAAYVVDNGKTAIIELRKGSHEAALLLIPNLIRAFVVLVMSSSAGVAIGVNEGIAVVLREAERYSTLGDQMLVFMIGVFAFGVVFQLGFACVRIGIHLFSNAKSSKTRST
ncbi:MULTISPECIES: hypothetical protein [unclassified Ruegeria]|uniref:hypothetical protein n=1 Tax=unclassified Ruegeria TaxID=2625375 RepID=UPI0014893D2A|nr:MULTISPECIES: hypothetical protein [unclassified Ruegeria]